MKFTVGTRKNLVIFSLVLMLGLIGYVNYNLNQQALLETSSELEKYELTMMEESGILNYLLDETAVFNEGEETEVDDIALEDIEQENLEQNIEKDKDDGEDKKLSNAIVVDSRSSNEITELARASNTEITEAVTSKNLMKSSSYFIESRLERDKKRSEMVTSLNSIINNQNTGEEIKNQALNMKLNTIANTEKEVFVENMIMAKGFNDVIVYLSNQSINIVVSNEDLTKKDVAQIVDIVRRETNIAMDDIIIMSKK